MNNVSGRRRWPLRLLRIGIYAAIVFGIFVLLRATVLRPPRVAVARVMRGDVAAEVEGTGTTTVNILANVGARITGRVDRILVDERSEVRRGQLMAVLSRTGLERRVQAAAARLRAAQARVWRARRDWLREKYLVDTGAVSRQEADAYRERYLVAQRDAGAAAAELRDRQYQLTKTRVLSLVGGLVVKRWIDPGDAVVAGQKLFTVANPSVIMVDALVDQRFSGRLRAGEPATVTLWGERRPVAGHVFRVSPQANPAAEQLTAEVQFHFPLRRMEIGQWANVYIKTGEARNALVLPRAAVAAMGGMRFVLAVGPKDRLRRVPVAIIASSPRNPKVAVRGQLRPGERVALRPMPLRPGERIRPVAAVPGAMPAMPM